MIRKILSTIIFLALSPSALAGWTRASESTIKFSGAFEKSSYSEYLIEAANGYSILVLDSNGGVPSIALKIAEDVQKRNVTVVVEGVCVSACANYLAISGKRLEVACGSILAWHGTLDEPEAKEIAMKAQNEPQALIDMYTKWLRSFKRRERQFYAAAGVNYSLLADSVDILNENNIDREVIVELDEETGDYTVTQSAPLWIPTPNVLRSYGINTDGFCQNYTENDVKEIMKNRGISSPYTSKGKLRPCR